MRLKLKKSIVLCLICTLLLGMMGMDVSAADITYVYDDVGTMYALVNNFRQSGEGWYYNEGNQKVEGQSLAPLAYDYNLEKLAMQRAAELVANYAHRDLNSEISALGMNSWAENIAWGESYLGTANSIFTEWCEDTKDYNGQGHRRNMLSVDYPTTSIGIGHVKASNGRDYWVQVFGSGSGGGSRVDLNGTTSTPTQPEVPTYNVIEGSDAVWTMGSNSPMVMRIDADFSKFSGITINGVGVDPSDYDAWSGSTVISIKPEYMAILEPGYYTCRVSYTDGGYADVDFSVQAAADTSGNNDTGNTQNTSTATTPNNTRSPQTGDSTTGMIVVFLMLAAVSGVTVCLISRKKVR